MKSLYKYFGRQGGTVHQLENLTGVPASTLINGSPVSATLDSMYTRGWFAARTCDKEHRLKLAKDRQGCVDFWLGVRDSQT